MFTSAIDHADRFTRPLHFIVRFWGSSTVVPGTATLFFVNADGWALTCAHVARELQNAEVLLTKFNQFKTERATLPTGGKRKQALRALEKTHGYKDGIPVELFSKFVNCVDGTLELQAHIHPSLDIALLKFSNYTSLHCTTFPTFAANGADLKTGKYLCRLGYPFPEFSDFEYDSASDRIRWTSTGKSNTPRFPIEGMLTRHLLDAAGVVAGFETSTPGLKGQSGGPAFDDQGRVWGMQSATNHLDLDFDVNMDVLRAGRKKRISESALLHVGHCIHVDALKTFMKDKGVAFAEG